MWRKINFLDDIELMHIFNIKTIFLVKPLHVDILTDFE
jgi:hypothetical protein